jgi:hypothetical protein
MHMLHLFSVLYEHWQRLGEEALEIIEIERRLVKKGVSKIKIENSNYLFSTIANIRKKIDGRNLSSNILINHDSSVDGYSLVIKRS